VDEDVRVEQVDDPEIEAVVDDPDAVAADGVEGVGVEGRPEPEAAEQTETGSLNKTLFRNLQWPI
jgi:hypothetical protein